MFDGLPATLPCGSFRLDLEAQRLRDAEGREVRLRPRSVALLQALLVRAGRPVPRAHLMDAVWGEVHVTDDSLTQCVVELRRGLAGAGVTLRTLPRLGYMLETAESRRAATFRAGLHIPSLAEPGGPGGLGEALAAELRVSLAESVVVGEAAQRAPYRLEGSVRRAGRRLRVTVALVRCGTGQFVGAERFDCGASLAGQDQVVDRIACWSRARLAAC